MSDRQVRWLLLALASGLVTFVVVRRRQQIAAALPPSLAQHAERFVIPWPTDERDDATTDTDTADDTANGADSNTEDESENDESLQRKVSRGYRISFRGKRYGPLPESLLGEYVDIETRDGMLYILHNGKPIANFELQS